MASPPAVAGPMEGTVAIPAAIAILFVAVILVLGCASKKKRTKGHVCEWWVGHIGSESAHDCVQCAHPCKLTEECMHACTHACVGESSTWREGLVCAGRSSMAIASIGVF